MIDSGLILSDNHFLLLFRQFIFTVFRITFRLPWFFCILTVATSLVLEFGFCAFCEFFF